MYTERIDTFGGVEIIELNEGHGGSAKPDERRTKEAEGESLLGGIPEGATIIALDAGGTLYTSEKFAKRLEIWEQLSGPVVFLIGGSWGLSDPVLAKADTILSLGPMTFPHGVARLLLVEQLYRAKMINNGRAYHK